MHVKIACVIHWPVNMSNEALEYEEKTICTTKVASSLGNKWFVCFSVHARVKGQVQLDVADVLQDDFSLK